jgi:hypothetical protein
MALTRSRSASTVAAGGDGGSVRGRTPRRHEPRSAAVSVQSCGLSTRRHVAEASRGRGRGARRPAAGWASAGWLKAARWRIQPGITQPASSRPAGRSGRGPCHWNVATVSWVSLSGSNSPALASSKILMATSSITGVDPVSSKRAQASLNAQFIAATCCSSSTVEFPTQLALSGYYRRENCRECELAHTRLRCAQKNPGRPWRRAFRQCSLRNSPRDSVSRRPAVRRIAIITDAFVTTSRVEAEAFWGATINANNRTR